MMRTAFLWLFLATASVAFSQNPSKKTLQQQRANLEKQLAMLNRQITQTNEHIHASAQQRAGLQKQISDCRQQINALDEQLGTVQHNLQQTDARLEEMYAKLVKLKKSYAASLVLSWKLMNEPQVIKVVYAANDANETQQRLQYIKVLRRLQLSQAQQIRALQQQFDVRRKQLGISEEAMTLRLKQQLNNSSQLSGKERRLDAEAQQLEKKKSNLLALLKRKKDMQRSVEDKLRALTAIPVRPAVKPADKPATKPTGKPLPPVRHEAPGTASRPINNKGMIAASKGFLPCPVNGAITMHFGRITLEWGGVIDNQFLTFQTTNAGAPVAAIYAGTVTAVESYEDKYIVFVLHGDVYSVYGELLSASVQKGQQVIAGTVLGKTSLNTETGKGEMEFGIYENKKLVNPEHWLGCH